MAITDQPQGAPPVLLVAQAPTTGFSTPTEIEMVRFSYLTNLPLPVTASAKQQIIIRIIQAGRLRWKIENAGFHMQKNHGYHLSHKFSRNAIDTLHVYYILIQIAPLLNQLLGHATEFAKMKTAYKFTLKHIREEISRLFRSLILCEQRLARSADGCQIRLE